MTPRIENRMKWSLALLIFATGLPLGWLLRSDGHAGLAPELSPVSQLIPARRQAASKPGTADAWNSFGEKMRTAEFKDAMRMWNELAPSDRLAAMEAMAEPAGLDRVELRRHLGVTMRDALKDWMESDLEGALAAARTTSNPDLQQLMIRETLNYLIGRDFDRLVALEKEFPQPRMRFETSVVEKAVAATLRMGATEYLATLEKLEFIGTHIGTSGQFSEDFDFRLAADGVAKLMESRNGSPPSFPANFLTEWARKDPEAAYAWWAANEALPFSNLSEIIEVLESNSPQQSAAWMAAKIQQPAAPREKIIRELGRANPQVLSARLDPIAKAMPDTASADAFLIDFIRLNSAPELDRQYSMAFVLSSMSSPATRLSAIRSIKEDGGILRTNQFTDEQFNSWDISRDEVASILTQ